MYYNSHGHPMYFGEFIELEVESRENYEMEEIEQWKRKYNISNDTECIWITRDEETAYTYHDDYLNNYPFQKNVVKKINPDAGFLIPESDDGDNGFLMIIKNNDILYDAKKVKKRSSLIKIARGHRQDDSLPILLDLIEKGYDRAVWHLHESHTVYDICDIFNGKVFDLNKMTSNLEHEAPLFEASHVNCYKNDVEVYTDKGWKLFKDLDKTEYVGTINPQTLEFEWQKPFNYIQYHYTGNLINFKSKNIDISVTPEHRWFMNMSHYGEYKKESSKKYRFITYDNIINPIRTYKNVEEIKNFNGARSYGIPIVVSNTDDNDDKIVIENLEFEQKDFALLMGYYLSEGNCKHGGGYQVSISQKKHFKKMLKDLKNVFRNTDINVRKNGDKIEFNNKELYKYLDKFGHSYEKHIPDEIKSMNRKALNVFIDAYILGDGNIRKNKTLKGQKNESIGKYIYTSSKRLADDFAEVILKSGHSVSYKLLKYKDKIIKHKNGEYAGNHDIWRIGVKNSDVVRRYKLLDEQYDDNVYCVSVPNETLLVRSNGKVLFSGNCRCFLICYSTTNPDLEYITIDWRGMSETGRVVDRQDKEDRRRDFYKFYNEYEEALNNLKTNKFLTGKHSEPENGYYSFDITVYGDYGYNQNVRNHLKDEILEIILNEAQRYGIKVDDAWIAGNDYVISTDNSLSMYEFSKTDLMDITWTLEDRRKDLQGLMMDLKNLENFLTFTQEKINEVLMKYDADEMMTTSMKKKGSFKGDRDYWVSPAGVFFELPLQTQHYSYIENHLDEFGLSYQQYIDMDVDEILIYLFQKGWVRVNQYSFNLNIQAWDNSNIVQKILDAKLDGGEIFMLRLELHKNNIYREYDFLEMRDYHFDIQKMLRKKYGIKKKSKFEINHDYWYNINTKKIIDVTTIPHYNYVRDHPEKFGMTEKQYNRYNSIEVREKVLTNGWVRINNSYNLAFEMWDKTGLKVVQQCIDDALEEGNRGFAVLIDMYYHSNSINLYYSYEDLAQCDFDIYRRLRTRGMVKKSGRFRTDKNYWYNSNTKKILEVRFPEETHRDYVVDNFREFGLSKREFNELWDKDNVYPDLMDRVIEKGWVRINCIDVGNMPIGVSIYSKSQLYVAQMLVDSLLEDGKKFKGIAIYIGQYQSNRYFSWKDLEDNNFDIEKVVRWKFGIKSIFNKLKKYLKI